MLVAWRLDHFCFCGPSGQLAPREYGCLPSSPATWLPLPFLKFFWSFAWSEMFTLNPFGCLESWKFVYCLLVHVSLGPIWWSWYHQPLHEVSYWEIGQPVGWSCRIGGLQKRGLPPPCLLPRVPVWVSHPALRATVVKPEDHILHWTLDTRLLSIFLGPLYKNISLEQKTVLELLPSCGILGKPLTFSEADCLSLKWAGSWNLPPGGNGKDEKQRLKRSWHTVVA